MQDTWCVYRHISPSNKVYIGITSRKPDCRNRDTYINVRQSGGFIWKWCNKEKGVGI